MFGNSAEKHQTARSPKYDLPDKSLSTALTVGGSLMLATVGLMILLADTFLGSSLSALYRWPIVGMLVFGLIISGGRYLGLKGVKEGSTGTAVFGSAILVLGYGWIGGGILHPYEPSLYIPAIALTGTITTIIALLAGLYVYTTDKNLEQWRTYSAYAFFGAIGTSFIGSFIFTPLILLSFLLALLGFLADLVYEIWMASNGNRSAYANGIALYVAFAGVFIHILQLVLRALADS
jgi:FtsH-binding integral membrane protein